MVSRKPTDTIDGPPFLIGVLTILKQFNSQQTDVFIQFMAQYIKSIALDSSSK